MATSLRQAQMLFGPGNVTKIGTNGAHYQGTLMFSNVTLIDPSTGGIGICLTLLYVHCCVSLAILAKF
jgi:hypothetical protein